MHKFGYRRLQVEVSPWRLALYVVERRAYFRHRNGLGPYVLDQVVEAGTHRRALWSEQSCHRTAEAGGDHQAHDGHDTDRNEEGPGAPWPGRRQRWTGARAARCRSRRRVADLPEKRDRQRDGLDQVVQEVQIRPRDRQTTLDRAA